MSVAEPTAPPVEDAADPDARPPGVIAGTPGGYGPFHGMRMRRAGYHALHEETPPGFRAESIGGRVDINRDGRGRAGGDLWDDPGGPLTKDQMSLKRRHGRMHSLLIAWLDRSLDATPVAG